MYTLIIVDDEDITRSGISDYIQRTQQHFKVEGTFSNGLDALNYLKEHPVNIVITDIRMPGMDGLQLAKYIFENHPGTIIMIISGYGEFEYAKQAMCYGVSTYLLKPLDFSELTEHLGQAYQKLSALRPNIDIQEENIQLFFTDLIGGILTDSDELKNRFHELALPGSLSDYKGCLLTVILENNVTSAHWQYGREQLAVALLNSIRMVLTEYQCFHLFRSGMRYFFIILSCEKVPDFSIDMLKNMLYHLLHFSCEIKLQTSFTSIDTLAISTIRNKTAEVPHVKDDAPASKTLNDNDDIIIQRAITYIQSHFSEDLTREDVADAVFLSSAYFSRFFKRKTGMNFIDYLTTVRMEKAAELLTTNMRVGDIAQKVGYQSRNRFFINFRQFSGYNPTEYRRQILKMEEAHEEMEE